jgi:hypothetical protein
MDDTPVFRIIKPLVSIACLICMVESQRAGSTLWISKTGIEWVTIATNPIKFWFANAMFIAFAILGLSAPSYYRAR